jgi:hypothetical protein
MYGVLEEVEIRAKMYHFRCRLACVEPLAAFGSNGCEEGIGGCEY